MQRMALSANLLRSTQHWLPQESIRGQFVWTVNLLSIELFSHFADNDGPNEVLITSMEAHSIAFWKERYVHLLELLEAL